ncbi:DUF58 domain-containing protein [Psychrosphaera sp. 1_MG-2023]|uniref:DUF58 domain-containing protein n=1 Tax=Psychrosphaera sp. 1_MG-2023 TaxID=3062643 RepID=UPI0026E35269|nr:DUF58 domain-containing protein [Psychrosphaera sp. 1_MG-2023]MDO6719501.1 DUF58 domain-containing protein [Psychrosphaera sp. 1_MG-2023]
MASVDVNSHYLDWLKQNELSGWQLSFAELVMYQKYTHLLNNKPCSKVKHHMSGQYMAKTKGRGMEFDEARHYQPGDDVRTIDWRVTARTGKTHTKIFREEKDRPIFVFCDLLPSMRFGSQLLFKSVQACHLSALVAWKAMQNGDKIGGLVLSENGLLESKPKSRQQAVLKWLDGLQKTHNLLPLDHKHAFDQTELETKFTEACAHLRRVAHPGSLVYLISDFQHVNDTALQHLFQLQKHCEVVACWVNDPIEHSLPKLAAGSISVTDGQLVKQIDSDSQLEQYQDLAKSRFNQQKQNLTQFKIRWLPICAGTPLHEQL